MRGFVLAAGFGTRLRPLTDHVPKALVSVCGRPLIERSLSFLMKNGIETIGVNAHYLAERLFEYQKSTSLPFELFHEHDAIRGTGGAFHFARDFLMGDDIFFVCNVDIVHDVDLAPLMDRFKKSDFACGLLAVKPETGAARGSIYYRQDDGQYTGVPAEGPLPRGSVGADYIGAAFYRREFLGSITANDFSIVPVWKRAIAMGLKTGVIIVDKCYWRDIGTPGSLARAHFDALEGRVQFDVPEYLAVDTMGRRCWNRDLPPSLLHTIGPLSWVETERVPEECHITNSVIVRGASLADAASVDHAIITPHCEVPFV